MKSVLTTTAKPGDPMQCIEMLQARCTKCGAWLKKTGLQYVLRSGRYTARVCRACFDLDAEKNC